MKFISITIIMILFLVSCGNTEPDNTEFLNAVCKDFIKQGYPNTICSCIDDRVSTLENITEVSYEMIEKIVSDCVEKNIPGARY